MIGSVGGNRIVSRCCDSFIILPFWRCSWGLGKNCSKGSWAGALNKYCWGVKCWLISHYVLSLEHVMGLHSQLSRVWHNNKCCHNYKSIHSGYTNQQKCWLFFDSYFLVLYKIVVVCKASPVLWEEPIHCILGGTNPFYFSSWARQCHFCKSVSKLLCQFWSHFMKQHWFFGFSS